MSEMLPGSYKGKVCGMDSGAVGANKTPVAKVIFLLENGKKVTWTGWFSEKTNQKTGKTYSQLVVEKLVDLGFTGSCVSVMSNPSVNVDEVFNTSKEWDLEIDYQKDKNGEVTKYFEVKWINDPDKASSSKLDHVEATTVFKGMNLSGLIKQAQKEASADIPF